MERFGYFCETTVLRDVSACKFRFLFQNGSILNQIQEHADARCIVLRGSTRQNDNRLSFCLMMNTRILTAPFFNDDFQPTCSLLDSKKHSGRGPRRHRIIPPHDDVEPPTHPAHLQSGLRQQFGRLHPLGTALHPGFCFSEYTWPQLQFGYLQ